MGRTAADMEAIAYWDADKIQKLQLPNPETRNDVPAQEPTSNGSRAPRGRWMLVIGSGCIAALAAAGVVAIHRRFLRKR